MKEKKKLVLFGIGGLICFLLVIGVSYAIWQIVLQQTNENVVTTGCFKINFTEKNDIQLNNAYPIIDSEGKKLTPYEFTLENTCDSMASYQVNLEILDSTTLEYFEYIKVMYNEKIPKILTKYEEVEKNIDEATTAYKLGSGYLEANETKTFTLRLWMDEDTPPNEESMNKIFKSKVSIISSYLETKPIKNVMQKMGTEICYEDEYWYKYYCNTYVNSNPYWNYETDYTIVFEDEINPHYNADLVVDFSEAKDESVLGYYVTEESEDFSFDVL